MNVAPTISMHWTQFSDGSFGVELMMTGLDSQQQAEAAMLFMQKQLCGAEMGEH